MDVIRTDFTRARLMARSSGLGFLIALTLFGAFIIDIGLPNEVSAWAPYSIAIVLALLLVGVRTVASDDMKGRPLFRVFRGKRSPIARGGKICHWARHKSNVVREKVIRRRDGSRCMTPMMVKPAENRFRRHHGWSLVKRNRESPSVIKGRSSKSRPVSSVLRDNNDVVLYRCRFEPRRTLNYIDVKNGQLHDDSGGDFQSMYGQALNDWMHPLDRQRAWHTIEEAVRAQRPYVLVYRLIGTVGKDQWVWDEAGTYQTFLKRHRRPRLTLWSI